MVAWGGEEQVEGARMEDEQDKSKILGEAKKKLDTAEETKKVSGEGKVANNTKK